MVVSEASSLRADWRRASGSVGVSMGLTVSSNLDTVKPKKTRSGTAVTFLSCTLHRELGKIALENRLFLR